MVFVHVIVRSDDDSVGELASGQCLLRFLAINHCVELHVDLKHTQTHALIGCGNNGDSQTEQALHPMFTQLVIVVCFLQKCMMTIKPSILFDYTHDGPR